MSIVSDESAAEIVAEEKEPRAYEVMFILKPDLLEAKTKQKLQEFEKFVTHEGGKILYSDFWGTRRLSYRINRCTEGLYGVYGLEVLPGFTKEVNQHLRIDPEVVRHMLITLPAGYQYQKYQEEAKAAEEKEERPKVRRRPEKLPSLKEVIRPAETKGEVSEEVLEKKLDELLSDSDLKL